MRALYTSCKDYLGGKSFPQTGTRAFDRVAASGVLGRCPMQMASAAVLVKSFLIILLRVKITVVFFRNIQRDFV